ncbi:15968_t:CDS:2 [Funneliformis caledonium]|uniref:15968_t:CDS:1 n=1 Tax=Funneliformis caledonium TaxID=1117310 RepID=A0A9N8Z692_9GLOM|nr:15968_t:CDS:2 [Funneliformis caledonium]
MPFSSDGEFSAPKVFSTKITQEGKHWFYCGVPGHCESGMYSTLVVGNDDSGGTNNETTKIINQEGQNVLIFAIAFILFGFIMDLLFLFYDARKVPELYITSLVVLIVPFGLNVVFMTATIIHEIKTSEHNWFKEISTYFLALVIIVIGSDFDAWKLLESRIGNLKGFNAPLSDTSKMFMLWCNLLSKGLEAIKHIKHNAGEDEKNHSVDTSEESRCK